MQSCITILFLLVGTAFGTCHNLDTTTAFQDVVRRWLAEENGTTLREFNILSQSWLDPNFLSTNPCITFTVKDDTTLTAVFEPEQVTEAQTDPNTVGSVTQTELRIADETQLPYVEGICYTLGGKHRLYSDCRYTKDKQWSPTICDPNEICLTCVARRVREE